MGWGAWRVCDDVRTKRVEFFSILFRGDVPHDGLGHGDRSWRDGSFDRVQPRLYNNLSIRESS